MRSHRKPEIAAFGGTVENEAPCTHIARRPSLVEAGVETTQIGGRKLIVVEGYDRQVAADGPVEHITNKTFFRRPGSSVLDRHARGNQ